MVIVERDLQVTRLVNRNGLSEEAALQRINAQISNDERKKVANVVLDNNSTPEELQLNVQEQLQELRNRHSATNKM